MAKYLSDASGIMTEVQPVATSAGAGDSGKLAQLDGTGRFDISFMPVGVGAEVLVMNTDENISAGAFVNYRLSGTLMGRNADASTVSKPALGFVLASTVSGNNASVYGISNTNTAVAGLTIGTRYYLTAAATGVPVSTAPSASGNIVQYLGVANAATSMVFTNADYWVKV